MTGGTLESAIGYFKSSDTEIETGFGRSVSVSADGHTFAASVNTADYAGAVYVHVQSGGQWQQQAYLKASNTDAQDNFGWKLSLNADGNTLAVSANYENSAATGINGNQNDNSRRDVGAVYVFVRNAGEWRQQAYLKASNSDTDDNFGSSLSLSGDGNTLVVSAPRERSAATGFNGDQLDNSARDSGAVYLF